MKKKCGRIIFATRLTPESELVSPKVSCAWWTNGCSLLHALLFVITKIYWTVFGRTQWFWGEWPGKYVPWQQCAHNYHEVVKGLAKVYFLRKCNMWILDGRNKQWHCLQVHRALFFLTCYIHKMCFKYRYSNSSGSNLQSYFQKIQKKCNHLTRIYFLRKMPICSVVPK